MLVDSPQLQHSTISDSRLGNLYALKVAETRASVVYIPLQGQVTGKLSLMAVFLNLGTAIN